MSSIASSEVVFRVGDLVRPLEVRRHARARGFRLSVDPHDGRVRLTVPPRVAVGSALAWARSKQDWVEARLAAVPRACVLTVGASVPIDGQPRLVVSDPAVPRRVLLDTERVTVGGPAELAAHRLARWLLAEAQARLAAETAAMACRAGVGVVSVRIGDPRARWGSCTGAGAIRYSWRLLMAPAAVREAVVAHEVAHRLHMNHSPAFHRTVAELLGREPKVERAWLRKHHAALHAVLLPVRSARGGTQASPA